MGKNIYNLYNRKGNYFQNIQIANTTQYIYDISISISIYLSIYLYNNPIKKYA